MRLAFYKAENGKWLDREIARHDDPYLYSHVELAFWPTASDGRVWQCFSSSWRDGGVRYKHIDLSDGKWDMLKVPASGSEITDVYHWCYGKRGGKYDIPGVLAFKIPLIRELGNCWFCSEICTAALQQVGLFGGVRPSKLSPNALFLLARLYGMQPA